MSKVFTISELTFQIKDLLEGNFTAVKVKGEISNFKPSGSGHLYFTLKDENAAISAVMFKGKTRSLEFAPKDGMTVEVSGSLSLYEKRGVYQIVIDKMTKEGEGDILKMLEERKRRLAAEGLFDSENKKALPFFPRSIAVITSPTGAAVRDIITVVRRRNPKTVINILPAVVQGEEAAGTLIRQINIANMHKLGDLIILGRGGGSIEDLLPFSDEQLVRTVAQSSLPIISAVGHEIDWALSDFAADRRAATPSAAAEIAVPVLEDINRTISQNYDELLNSFEGRIEKIRLMLSAFSPSNLEMMFRRIVQPLFQRLDDAKEQLLFSMQNRLVDVRHKLAIINEIIAGADPQSILNRGYSIVKDKNTGKTVRSQEDVCIGTDIIIKPASGTITAKVLDN